MSSLSSLSGASLGGSRARSKSAITVDDRDLSKLLGLDDSFDDRSESSKPVSYSASSLQKKQSFTSASEKSSSSSTKLSRKGSGSKSSKGASTRQHPQPAVRASNDGSMETDSDWDVDMSDVDEVSRKSSLDSVSGGVGGNPGLMSSAVAVPRQSKPASGSGSTTLADEGTFKSRVTKWYQWLGLDPQNLPDAPFLKVAESHALKPLPEHWRFVDGVYMHVLTGSVQSEHPLVDSAKTELITLRASVSAAQSSQLSSIQDITGNSDDLGTSSDDAIPDIPLSNSTVGINASSSSVVGAGAMKPTTSLDRTGEKEKPAASRSSFLNFDAWLASTTAASSSTTTSTTTTNAPIASTPGPYSSASGSATVSHAGPSPLNVSSTPTPVLPISPDESSSRSWTSVSNTTGSNNPGTVIRPGVSTLVSSSSPSSSQNVVVVAASSPRADDSPTFSTVSDSLTPVVLHDDSEISSRVPPPQQQRTMKPAAKVLDFGSVSSNNSSTGEPATNVSASSSTGYDFGSGAGAGRRRPRGQSTLLPMLNLLQQDEPRPSSTTSLPEDKVPLFLREPSASSSSTFGLSSSGSGSARGPSSRNVTTPRAGSSVSSAPVSTSLPSTPTSAAYSTSFAPIQPSLAASSTSNPTATQAQRMQKPEEEKEKEEEKVETVIVRYAPLPIEIRDSSSPATLPSQPQQQQPVPLSAPVSSSATSPSWVPPEQSSSHGSASTGSQANAQIITSTTSSHMVQPTSASSPVTAADPVKSPSVEPVIVHAQQQQPQPQMQVQPQPQPQPIEPIASVPSANAQQSQQSMIMMPPSYGAYPPQYPMSVQMPMPMPMLPFPYFYPFPPTPTSSQSQPQALLQSHAHVMSTVQQEDAMMSAEREKRDFGTLTVRISHSSESTQTAPFEPPVAPRAKTASISTSTAPAAERRESRSTQTEQRNLDEEEEKEREREREREQERGFRREREKEREEERERGRALKTKLSDSEKRILQLEQELRVAQLQQNALQTVEESLRTLGAEQRQVMLDRQTVWAHEREEDRAQWNREREDWAREREAMREKIRAATWRENDLVAREARLAAREKRIEEERFLMARDRVSWLKAAKGHSLGPGHSYGYTMTLEPRINLDSLLPLASPSPSPLHRISANSVHPAAGSGQLADQSAFLASLGLSRAPSHGFPSSSSASTFSSRSASGSGSGSGCTSTNGAESDSGYSSLSTGVPGRVSSPPRRRQWGGSAPMTAVADIPSSTDSFFSSSST
eukprot:ANDGO_05089.mRNA.1 hypothetical protein